MQRVPYCSTSLALLVRLKRVEGLLHELAAQFFFVVGRQLGVAGDVNDAGAQHYAVGADHLGDGQGGSNLDYRNAGFFQFSRYRSAAASAGPSRRSKNHRVGAVSFYFLGHLAAEPAGI